MRELLAELGGKPLAGSPDDFGKVIAAGTAKWAKVVNSSGPRSSKAALHAGRRRLWLELIEVRRPGA